MKRITATIATAALAATLGATVAHAAAPAFVAPMTAPQSSTAAYVYGALRCDPATGTWAMINDSAHASFGVNSVTSTSTTITIHHAAITKVGAVSLDPDETYVANGISAGASVGLDTIVITPAKNGVKVSPASICLDWSNFWVQAETAAP
jgi:hypothetical protein